MEPEKKISIVTLESMDMDREVQSKKKKKVKEDFATEVDTKLPELAQMARNANVQQALEQLFALEKKTRQGEDEPSTAKVASCIVEVCFETKDWELLKSNLVLISKRRGQLKGAIQAAVKTAMDLLPQISDEEATLGVINTLLAITEGKIYVEVEGARLSRMLAKMKEDKGLIGEAADLMQEIQVETFGAMEPREKIEFILEQMRLCLAKREYVRAQIISKKIASHAISKDDVQDLKLRYFELMVQYYAHSKDYLNICRSYQSMYGTKVVQETKEKWQHFLRLMVVYIVLAPFDNEQSDLIHRISQDKKLIELPEYRKLLKYFTTIVLIRWPQMLQDYTPILNQLPIFQGESGEELWKDLRSRVVQHNIRVVAQYYQRIKMDRFSGLLDLSDKETEKYVSEMVSAGTVWAKIDRPKGIVSFTKRKDPNDVLNDWAHNVSDLLTLLEKTCHLIHRENMVYKIDTDSSSMEQ